jgi:hypothetical protein
VCWSWRLCGNNQTLAISVAESTIITTLNENGPNEVEKENMEKSVWNFVRKWIVESYNESRNS